MRNKGITLIALIITIIILLILASITIATLTGENGIITKAFTTKEQTETADIIERVKIDILGEQAKNQSGNITKKQLKEVLDKYFKNVPDEIPDSIDDLILTSKDQFGEHKIKVVEIWNGTFAIGEKPKLSAVTLEKSYVGYYADIDEDGTVDGVIYADLAKGNTGSGQYYGEEYTIPVIEGTKDYYVSKENYEGPFGTKDVLAPASDGEDRFYIMTLTDVPLYSYGKKHWNCPWYYAAYRRLSDLRAITSYDFGSGRTNSFAVYDKWFEDACGDKNEDDDMLDLWAHVSNYMFDGWFVPSVDEWAAFFGELNITKENYKDFGLYEDQPYWTSSVDETPGYDGLIRTASGYGSKRMDAIYMALVRLSYIF